MKVMMGLNEKEFDKIAQGRKTIEVRLFDEKRSRLRVNDIIEFTNNLTSEVLLVWIMYLVRCKKFVDLFPMRSLSEFGPLKDEDASNLLDGARLIVHERYTQ